MPSKPSSRTVPSASREPLFLPSSSPISLSSTSPTPPPNASAPRLQSQPRKWRPSAQLYVEVPQVQSSKYLPLAEVPFPSDSEDGDVKSRAGRTTPEVLSPTVSDFTGPAGTSATPTRGHTLGSPPSPLSELSLSPVVRRRSPSVIELLNSPSPFVARARRVVPSSVSPPPRAGKPNKQSKSRPMSSPVPLSQRQHPKPTPRPVKKRRLTREATKQPESDDDSEYERMRLQEEQYGASFVAALNEANGALPEHGSIRAGKEYELEQRVGRKKRRRSSPDPPEAGPSQPKKKRRVHQAEQQDIPPRARPSEGPRAGSPSPTRFTRNLPTAAPLASSALAGATSSTAGRPARVGPAETTEKIYSFVTRGLPVMYSHAKPDGPRFLDPFDELAEVYCPGCGVRTPPHRSDSLGGFAHAPHCSGFKCDPTFDSLEEHISNLWLRGAWLRSSLRSAFSAAGLELRVPKPVASGAGQGGGKGKESASVQRKGAEQAGARPAKAKSAGRPLKPANALLPSGTLSSQASSGAARTNQNASSPLSPSRSNRLQPTTPTRAPKSPSRKGAPPSASLAGISSPVSGP